MRIYCDTHVHCYDFNDIDLLLDSAHQNLRRQAAQQSRNDEACYILFFTDGKIDKTWPKIQECIENPREHSTWSLSYNPLGDMVYARSQNRSMILAPARQIISAEHLEFLLIGCKQNIEDGIPAEQIIEEYQQFAIICPWGVGKWLGNRGQILSSLISQFGEKFNLGDNGSRPTFWRNISHFKSSENIILNGSDPLPLSGELARVGTFGVSFDIDSNDLSLDNLLAHLKSPRIEKNNFGKLLPVFNFLKLRWDLWRK